MTGFNSKQQISTVYNKFQLVSTGLDCLQQDCLQSFNCLQQVLIVYKFKLFTTSVDSLQVSTVDNKFRMLLNLLFFVKWFVDHGLSFPPVSFGHYCVLQRLTASNYHSIVCQLLLSKFEISLVKFGTAQPHTFSFYHYAALTTEMPVPLPNLKKI